MSDDEKELEQYKESKDTQGKLVENLSKYEKWLGLRD